MKKKITILLIALLTLTGCTNLTDMNIDEIVDVMLSDTRTLSNNVFDGYQYYIPRGIKFISKDDYNASLKDEYNNTYYFYIDIISYYNEEKIDYTENNED